MAEELKCVLMSTPKYSTNKSRRPLQDDKLRWSPDSIVARGNLMPESYDCVLDPVVKDSGDSPAIPHHLHPHSPWGSNPLTSAPPPLLATNRVSPIGRPGKFFGTPTFSARRERAAQLGIQPAWMEASFEGNQSFPKASRQRHSRPDPTPGDITMNPVTAGPKLEALQGDGLNDISFASSQPRKKYFPRLKDGPAVPAASGAPGHKALSESWSFSGFLGNAQSLAALPSTVRNPNKAICTIAAATSEILTANDMACELFGYEENELVGRPLKDLLRLKSKEQETIMESHLEPSGQIISLAGKVVEVLDSHGLVLPISLWVKRLDSTATTTTTTTSPQRGAGGEGTPLPQLKKAREDGSRLLCVMEPVERTVGHVTFDAEGEIQWCDDHMAQLCGYAGPHQVSGLHMTQIIPAFHCPDPMRGLTKEVKKQRATGRTRDGMSFPLSIVVRPDDDVHDGRWVPPSQELSRGDCGSTCPLYRATVWVFANISGLISIRPDGTIHSLNDNFARLLFGYNRCELIGHSISKLIPDFFDLLELESDPMPLPPLGDDDDEAVEEEREWDQAGLQGRTTPQAVGHGFCSPSLSPREGGPQPATTSTPAVSHPVGEILTHVTSTPCCRAGEDSVVSSDRHVSASSASLKEGRLQKDSCTERTEFSPLLVHNISSPVSCVHQSDHDMETNVENRPVADEVGLDSSDDLAGCVARVSDQTVDRSVQGIAENRWEGRFDMGKRNLMGSGSEIKDAVGANVEISVQDTKMIVQGLCKKSEVTDRERDRNNSSRREDLGSDLELNNRVTVCEDVRQHAIGEENSAVLWLGDQGGIGSQNPMQGQGYGSDGVIGCDDVDVDVVHCDNESPPLTCDEGVEPASFADDLCTMLSPIKSIKPHLLEHSFPSSSSDDENDYIGDTTNDLLTARVSAYNISDVVWPGDEGQGLSLDQGVTADVSGNIEDSPDRERRSSLEDGRISRLSHSDSYSLHTKVISDGLDSGSSTSEEVEALDDQFLSLLPPPSYPPRPCLDSSRADSTPYLEEESSYFSRDGASLSQACTDSTESQSSSGCAQGISDISTRDVTQKRKSFRDASTNISKAADIERAEPSEPIDPKMKVEGHQHCQIPEGSFSGQGRHKDGGTLGIVFQIRRVVLTDGSTMLLLWLSRDPEEACEASRSHGNLTLASSFSSTLDQSQHSLGELLQEQANSDSKLEDIQEAGPPPTTFTTTASTPPQPPAKVQSGSDSPNDEEEERHEVSVASAGEFSEHYTALSSIGKGAFGFVKLGRRWKDGQEVVVKFIRRAKVLRESWVKDATLGVIPMEVYLLLRLNHPNIVKVMDVFQNSDFIQLVMERHGSGMDLFEFIDRNPVMDEALTAYIFRQMVAAVSYLHSENVVHRDIKDENIIIDERFHIKLIDFGAATYMLPGRLFATFCGTIEYCSPEVLGGNKYRGPELEMWSLGITLYTLIFGENPFFDVEETLQGVLKPPATVSRALMFLITWLLHPDPVCRATVSDLERNAWVNQPVDITRYQWEKVLPNTEFFGNTACDNREDTPDHSVLSHCGSAGTVRKYRQDSQDSFSCYSARDNSALSSANNSVGHQHGSTNSSAHSSAGSSSGHGDTTADHSPSGLGSSGEHHSRGKNHSSHSDGIGGVASDFSRLLQLHSRLDSDY